MTNLRSQKLKHMRAIALISAIGILAAACGTARATAKPSNTTSSKPAVMTTVIVGYQPVNLSDLYYAQATNMCKAYGIKIVANVYESGLSLFDAAAGGSLDILQMGPPPYVTALAKGLPLKLISISQPDYPVSGLYASPTLHIKTLADLRGQTVGVPKDTTAQIALYEALKKANIPISTVNVVQYSTAAELYLAYVRHDVNIAWQFDTFGLKMEADGADLVGTDESFGVYSSISPWEATSQFLQKHPRAAAEFVACMNAAGQLARKHPSVVEGRYESATGLNKSQVLILIKKEATPTIAQMLSRSYPLSFVSPSGILLQLQRSAEVLVALKTISSVPSSLDSSVDASVLRAAARIRPQK